MPVDHQFTGQGVGEIIPQWFHIIPALGGVDDSLNPAVGQIESTSSVFPSRQHSLEGIHWLGGKYSPPPPGPVSTAR